MTTENGGAVVRVRRWSVNGVVLLFVIAGCLGTLELVLRYAPFSPLRIQSATWLYHPRAIYAFRPGSRRVERTSEFRFEYNISAQGLRDREFGPKPEGTRRILCLGDSFTAGQGVQVEDSYPKQLEQLIWERRPDLPIEVMNAGTPNYGVWQEAILLEEKGLALEPDLVILQVLPSNDVRDALCALGKAERAYSVDHLRTLETWLAYGRATGARKVISRSFLARAIKQAAARFRKGPPGPSVVGGKVLPPPEDRPWWMEPYLKQYYPELEEGWRHIEASMTRCKELCGSIPLVVLSVPDSSAVLPFSLEGYDARMSDYDIDKAPRLLAEICGRLDLPFISAVELFRDPSSQKVPLYFPIDGHPTAHGNRLVAECVYAALKQGVFPALKSP